MNIREQEQKEFFNSLKEKISMLEKSNTFLEKNKSLFNIMFVIENRKESYNKKIENKDKKYEDSEIYLSTLKLFESSENNFINLEKDILLYKKMLSEYVFFREITSEKEKELINNISPEEYKNYKKSFKKENQKQKVNNLENKNQKNVDYGVSL